MADTMQFDLVSPERRLTSLKVSAIEIPGADGDMTAMPDHAPLITTLRPGILKVSGPEGQAEYAVFGGFAEISAEAATVLAEEALPRAELTQDMLADRIRAATEALNAASGEAADLAAKRVADLRALGAATGLPV